ncbi:MAG: VOC family protein [Proteobacteria bacterium]|nr:VOC family protein [Pseudomonadota bacterium]
MLGYVTIGANDPEKSGKFYDAVFGAIGSERKFADGGWIGYGKKGEESHSVYVCPPHDKKTATIGNGSMFAFKANNTGEVKAAYEAGLKSGGSDEGAPGPRPADSKTFFGAYMRDPVGNKICVFCKP